MTNVPASMLEALLERAPDGLLLVSRDGIVERANAAAEAILAAESKIVGSPVSRWFPELESRLSASEIESYGLCGDGRSVPLEVSLIPLEEENHSWLLFRDISRRKKAETSVRDYARNLKNLLERRTVELGQIRQRYQRLYDVAPVLDFELDSQGSIASANRKACLSLGVPIDRMIGLPLTSLAVATERSALEQGMEKARDGSLVPFETRLRSADGAVVCVLFHACRNDSSRSSMRLVGLDVTARREAEHLVDQSLDLAEAQRARMERILRGIGESLVVTDPDGQVRLMNGAAERAFGVEEKFAFGRDLFSEQHDPEFVEAWNRFTAGEGDSFSRELAIGGVHERTFAVTVSRIQTPEGRPAGCAAILRDVSVDRQHDQAREEFFTNVAHGLRTPLASIRGFTTTILRGDEVTDRETRRFLGIVEKEALRLQRFIEDLVALASVEAGSEILQFRPANLTSVLEQVRRVFVPMATEKGVGLHVHAAEKDGTGVFDPDKVRRVLENLVGNALKFSPAGSRVDVELTREEERLCCSVRDAGRGMPPHVLERIFDRYYSSDPTLGPSGGGVGLHMAKRLVELHDGEIVAQSREGQGSTFRFWIPATPSVSQIERSVTSEGFASDPLIDDPDPLPLGGD